ncbi:MAG: FAD-binding oxidoreductase [Candidatus Heimdallarchaeaceae archaeon]|jgi:FAD/FMN-containing dehydrogenase
MTLKKKTRAKFVRHLGKQFKEDDTSLRIYSRDMSDLPSITKMFFKSVPDAIILPKTINEVQKLYELATENRVPVTPRSGGTTGFGGSVTYNKGIILDVKGLESEILIEPIDQSVTVNPSIIFSDLQRYLELDGFSLCSFPSSFHSATVGGWIAHGGYGIGSAKYGGALEQIISLEVVLPTGELVEYTEREDIELFVGSNGTLGLITKVKLKIKYDIPLKHYAFTFDSPQQLIEGLKEISYIDPFAVWFFNPKHVKELNNVYGYTLPDRYLVILSKEISFEEEESEFLTQFNQAIRRAEGQILDKRYTKNIWDIRFHTLSILKNYKDFLINEVILPIEKSGKYIQKLISNFNGQLHFEGELIGDSHYALLMYLYFEEEPSQLRKLFLNLKMYKNVVKAIRSKGYPYSTGLWYAGYYPSIFGKAQYKKYKEFKKVVDPKNISNPGKVISPRFRIFPLIKLKTAFKIASRFVL